MENTDKNWGKKLTGGLVGAVMVREIVQAVPTTAIIGIIGIVVLALVYMTLQYLSDRHV